MIIFEDHKNDFLSRLFRSSYSEEIQQTFCYAEGNGKLYKLIERLLYETDEQIIVYLDTMPGNKNIRTIYYKLMSLSRKNNFRVVILNISCAESLFLRSLPNNLVKHDASLQCATECYPYFSTNVYKADTKYCKTFEKFCKKVMVENTKDCIKPVSEINNKQNKYFDYFYSRNCLCDKAKQDCYVNTIKQKSINFLKEYPAIPFDENIECSILSTEKVWELHRKLIDKTNDMLDLWNKDPEVISRNLQTGKYHYIK